jgi:hypothetical protein
MIVWQSDVPSPSPGGGLADATKYSFVERVSWFSEFFFPGFNVTGHVVQPLESWSSSLFNPFGGLSPVGTAFFANCEDVSWFSA